MRVSDIKNIQEMLKANADTYFDTNLSIKLAELKLDIDKRVKVYNEVITRLLNECAVKEDDKYKTDNDGNVLIKDEKLDTWMTEYNKLDNTEFEINIKFTEAELNQMKMTPKQASSLILLKEDPKD